MHDLVIRNGTVVDGSGGPAFRADVAIDGDRISAIGDVTGSAWRTLDAEGRIVTPGFVDAHTHLDAQLMWDPLGTPYLFGPEKCEYERRPERSLGNVAAAHGETPAETVVRLFRETRGRQLFVATGSNHNPDQIEEILDRGDPLIGLGDAGAHVTAICDSSLTTHLLTYWCRERKKFSLEEAVRRITSDPAQAFGIRGRGLLQPGFFADVNVIDLDDLTMEVPEFVHDFPCGAGRWTQRARGYDFTLVNGQIAIEAGRHTGRLVGQVVRGSGTNTA